MSRPGNPEKTEENVDLEPGRTASEVPASQAPSAEAPPATEAEQKLAAELARLRAEKEELLETLIRRQADFDNYRKRIERERREDGDRARAAFAESLLAVLDGFERALAAHQDPAYEEYRKGFELLYRQLQDALARQRITRIEALGKPFDPYYHHAVERIETDEFPDGAVIEQLQAGYKFRDRILRPALVKVASRPKRPFPDPVH